MLGNVTGRWQGITVVGSLTSGLAAVFIATALGALPSSAGPPAAALHPPGDAGRVVPSVRGTTLPISESNYYTGTLGAMDGYILVGDTGGTVCRLSIVQPVTLAVLSDQATSCNDPRLVGEDVMPVESLPSVGCQIGDVRISVRDEATGTVHLGPVVMRYGNFSDTRPEWTYGGGYLWLYDVGTPSVAEVLRISASTGKVLATVRVPALSRVLLAADADGLWMAQSVESGWPAGHPRPALVYFLGAGAVAFKVVPAQGDYVNWLVAAGHTAWVNMQTGARSEVFATYPAPGPKPLSVAVAASNAQVPTNYGEGPSDAPPVMYDPGFGLIYAWPWWMGSLARGATEEAFRVDPATGRRSKVLAFPMPSASLQANLVYEGALYLLVGNQALAAATLYRAQL